MRDRGPRVSWTEAAPGEWAWRLAQAPQLPAPLLRCSTRGLTVRGPVLGPGSTPGTWSAALASRQAPKPLALSPPKGGREMVLI